MKPCLVDINVLLAVLAGNHVHYNVARKWFAGCETNEIGICRYVQLGVIRLLSSTAVMGRSALTGFAAYRVLHELLDLDERIEWVPDHAEIDVFLPRCLSHPMPATKAVNDAFLSAFALATKRRLVTFDGGFKTYQGLDLTLLEE